METKPSLLFFYSPSDGRSRRVEALLAQALQRNRNHETFFVRRIDVTRHPQVAVRFRVEKLPVLCVVEDRRVVTRLVAPRGTPEIRAALGPWLTLAKAS
jgi:thioredoxin-like negative regulator of GroEL